MCVLKNSFYITITQLITIRLIWEIKYFSVIIVVLTLIIIIIKMGKNIRNDNNF